MCVPYVYYTPQFFSPNKPKKVTSYSLIRDEHMPMHRTAIFMNPKHMAQLRALGEPQGLKPAQLVRIAIAQFLSRERRKQAVPVTVPGRARRQAVLLGE